MEQVGASGIAATDHHSGTNDGAEPEPPQGALDTSAHESLGASGTLRRRGGPHDEQGEPSARSAHNLNTSGASYDVNCPGRGHQIVVPRGLLPLMGVFIIVAISGLYALKRGEARKRRLDANLGSANSVTQLLDSEGLHHVELLVSNLTLSSQFYMGVLGAKEVDGELDSSGADSVASPPPPWRLLSFGNSHVALVEVARGPSGPSAKLAIRLAANTKPSDFLRAVQERLDLFSDLSASVACEAASSVSSGFVVASCRGPEGEVVEVWKPTVEVAKALERARKAWVLGTSVTRGRDLFE